MQMRILLRKRQLTIELVGPGGRRKEILRNEATGPIPSNSFVLAEWKLKIA
jgi:hypothetical protein